MEYTLKIAKTSSQQLHSTFHSHPKIIRICICTHYAKEYNIPLLRPFSAVPHIYTFASQPSHLPVLPFIIKIWNWSVFVRRYERKQS